MPSNLKIKVNWKVADLIPKNVDFEKFNASMIKHDDILSQHVDILIVGLGVGLIMKKGLKSHARILTV